MLIKDFRAFIKEYKVLSLAIAFVMGTASTALINSLVKDLLMPVVLAVTPGTTLKNAVLHLGPVTLAYGSFLAELINFFILALVVFVVVKKIIKDDSEKKL